jgi:hypothetical protein
LEEKEETHHEIDQRGDRLTVLERWRSLLGILGYAEPR